MEEPEVGLIPLPTGWHHAPSVPPRRWNVWTRISSLIRNTQLRALGARIATDAFLAPSVEVCYPHGISIGHRTQILRNSTLDARNAAHGRALEIGQSCRIKENVWLATYGGSISVGDNVLLGRNCIIHGHGTVALGDYSMCGPNVLILSSEHGHFLRRDQLSYQEQPEVVAPVRIGNNVWIGAGAIILPDVTIGEGAVVGAGAVVTRDLAPYEVHVGVPAKSIGPVPSTPFLGAVDYPERGDDAHYR